MAQGLAPGIPFVTDSRDGIKLIKDYIDLVNQNLTMLLLTSPGERIMDPYFGVGMKQFIFEMDEMLDGDRLDFARSIVTQIPDSFLPTHILKFLHLKLSV